MTGVQTCALPICPEEIFQPEIITPPYVLKVCSSKILHKTDQGGVFINVGTDEIEMKICRLREKFPGTSILVEEYISFQSPEFIVGGLVDPSFGPAVMIGAGGILTELFKDVAFRLAPCSFPEARRMLDELVISPVFSGFRGLKHDPDQLAVIITRAAKLILRLENRFSQLDINPLVYTRGKWIALDAKLVFDGSPADGELRIPETCRPE